MPERTYVVRRVGQALLVVVLVYTIVFFTLFVLPGDPVENKLTSPLNPLPPSAAEDLVRYYQLDLAPLQQFAVALGRLVRGDLGFSLVSGRPVVDVLAQGLSDTLVLAALAFVLTVVLSLAVALTAVFAPWGALRSLAAAVPVLSISAPSFLVGFVLLTVFSFQLGWVSSIRDQGLLSYVLPAATLAIAVNGPLSQVLVQGLTRARREPFVDVLRAKGVGERRIALGHVLRNGAVPSVTMLALVVGELFAGAVVVETVFSRTGLGFVTFESVRDQDTPVILAVVLLVSTLYVLVNLVTDLLYPRLDPRIVRRARPGRRPSPKVAVA
ncbi:ABC transporter permease [Cellulomonas sp. S1-8]|uniref:ABC transporter permease n=1 Tax=Cellulomonas sp. S1-8 TaxID=2904790 RepID=UPI0022447E9E|nr:ABC transporter permease [Cellulomonas sp. S1-8]UZN02044.1 ABC transporter permease [Cellulomonas sp. S1-8]